MEKELQSDQETCCTSQLETEFSLFGSNSFMEQTNNSSDMSARRFLEFGKKKNRIAFGTVTKRFILPLLPQSQQTVGPGTYTSELKWLPCENILVPRKAAPFNST